METQISAYMTSIRPYRWMKIFNMLKKTNLNFEIVIVGPIEPDFELPSEIKFFKSDVKPSQCQHAAAMLCQSKVLLQIVDDIEYEDGGIDAMYKSLIDNENTMSTCYYYLDGQDYSKFQNIVGGEHSFMPILPVCGMFKKEDFIKVGGIDKRFFGVMGELDLYMRLCLDANLKTLFVNYKCNEDRTFQTLDNSSLCDKFWNYDRPKIINLWTDESNQWHLIRNDELQKYSNENILVESQF